jgi:predicted amidohydrolase YtcJ
MTQPVSLLLRNARLWPDGERGSVFVDGGRIAALDERPADETIDLAGALLLPGFIDTHTHLGWAGAALWRVQWASARTRVGALAAVRAARGRLEPGFWLLGGGWKRDRLSDAELPTLEELDAASDGAPAFLVSEDGTLGLVNSHAMRLMRLAELADPAGGTIERDTGRLRDAATRAMMTRDVVPFVDRHRRLGELRAALRELPRLGITETHDIATYPGEPDPPLIRWERSWTDATLYDELDLPARITVRPSLHRRREFFGGAHPRLEGMKLFAGPAFRNPGRATTTEWIREAHEAGLSVSVHALDDVACAETIDLFEPCGPGGPRHRLVHARSLRRQDIARIIRLGLVVEAQPWDAIEDRRISDDPDAVELPLRSLLDAGAHIALGSDWRDDNLAPLDPLQEIRAAVERDEEAITVAEGIDCYTRGGAYAGGSDAHRGRIAPGFDADLVALAADPDAILDGEVRLTVCRGTVTYAA